MSVGSLFKSGKLAEAKALAIEEVKLRPEDTAASIVFCEILCFTGELERASKRLETVLFQDPDHMYARLLQQLIGAEKWRHDFYARGRVPELVGIPAEHLKLHLRASIELREGATEQGAKLLQDAATLRPRIRGVCDRQPFEEMADYDEFTASFFEVFTSTGKYLWIPFEQISIVEFHPIQQLVDRLWRRVRMAVADGPDGDVFLPSLYVETATDDDEQMKLGWKTARREGDDGPLRLVGQRTFNFGDFDCTMREMKVLRIDSVPSQSTGSTPDANQV